MRRHFWTVVLATLMVWAALALGLAPARVYAQSIGGGNGITGQGGSGFSIAGTGLTSSGPSTVSIIAPVTVANGGTQCGPPVAFASLPGSPTNGEICNVTDATACNAGTSVTSGGGSTKCQVTYNGTNWMPAGGASSSGGPPSGSASGDLGSTYPGPTVVQVEGAAIPASANLVDTNSSKQLTAPSNLSLAETTAPSGVASSDLLYPDSTAHRWKMNNNNGTAAQVVASGADINTSDQVTSIHLSAGLPRAQGGLNSTSAGTGIIRDGTTPAATELSGDATTSGSNAVTVVKVNGGSIPASATVIGTNSSNQIVSATVQGNGSKVQLFGTGTTTSGDCAKFDANGNIIDFGAACGGTGSPANPVNAYQFNNSGAFGGGNLGNTSGGAGFNIDTTGAITTVTNANTAGWLDPGSFGASYSTNTYTATFTSGSTSITASGNDFVKNEGIFLPNAGASQSLSTPSAPTVQVGECDKISGNGAGNPYTGYTNQSTFRGDIGVFFQRNMMEEAGVQLYNAANKNGTYTYAPYNQGAWAASTYYAAETFIQPTTSNAGNYVFQMEGGRTYLAANITSGATSLTVGAVDVAFPAPTFTAKIDSELVSVTVVTGSTWTITRAQGGTSASAHTAGAIIALAITTGGDTQPTWPQVYGNTVTETAGQIWKNMGTAGTYTLGTTTEPQLVCYGTSQTPSSGGTTLSISYKVAALDAAGGETAASTATTLTNVSLNFPTVTQPILVYEPAPVSNAQGYAFYEAFCTGSSCTLSVYKLVAIVWNNQPWLQFGSSLANANTGFADWGMPIATAEDVASQAPAAALNDDLFTTVSSVSGSTITVAVAPGITSSSCPLGANNCGVIYHDDTPAWTSLQTYCNTLPAGACRIQVAPKTTRVSTLNLTIPMTIEGQDRGSGSTPGSEMLFFGTAHQYCFNTQAAAIGLNQSGGQLTAFGDNLTLRNMLLQSDNTGGDCVVSGGNANGYAGILFQNIRINAPVGSYERLGFLVKNASGSVAMTAQYLMQDVDLYGADNTFQLDGLLGYTSTYVLWPGVLLYPEVGISGNNNPLSMSRWVFEGGWNGFRPDFATGSALGNFPPAGGVVGGHFDANYMADENDYNGTGASGFAETLINETSNDITPQGTLWTFVGGNNGYANYLEGGEAFCASFNWPNEGNVFVYDAAGGTALTGTALVVNNLASNCGAFGVLAEDRTTVTNSTFAAIATNGIGIGISELGSIVQGNVVTGAASSTGNTGYALGYQYNLTNQGCITHGATSFGPTILDFDPADLATLGTNVNACSTQLVRQNGSYLPVQLASYPTCSAAYEGWVGRANNCASTTLGTTCSGSGSTHASIICNGTNWVQLGY